MCKYCQDNYSELLRITDGSQVIELSFMRFISAQDHKVKKHVLNVGLSCKIGDGEYGVKDKEIKIKYCPFCGEKLV